MRVNLQMLPMKAHYFFSNAGVGPLVSYMSTYARQLGFSAYLVGIIYTFLPIFGLIAKPLFGAIADRFRKQKAIFIIFEVLTAVSFLAIYFIPAERSDLRVELSCGDGETFLKSCFANEAVADHCAAQRVVAERETAMCQMSCPMTTPLMWQTVCEHWRVPQYCYGTYQSLKFRTIIRKNESFVENDCLDFNLKSVIMDDNMVYNPKCVADHGIPYFGTNCNLYCPDKKIDDLIKKNSVTLSCKQNKTHLTSCSHETNDLKTFIDSVAQDGQNVECKVDCEMAEPWQWMVICDGWGADDAPECQPRTESGTKLPKMLNFTGVIPLEKTDQEKNCVYFKIDRALLTDGSSHYPTCPKHHTHNGSFPQFRSNCTILCDNVLMNEMISNTRSDSDSSSTDLTRRTFWLFFMLIALSWIGMAVVVSIGDAICFEMLGDKPSRYGQQRMWGSIGWGSLSLLTGVLIDEMSHGSETKNYTIAFVFMLVFTLLDILVSSKLKYKAANASISILKDVGLLITSWHTIIFLLWTITVGLCTGLLWQFLFWLLEELAENWECGAINYIKTLQGLVSAIQCFGGEVPVMFISGSILKRIGHIHSMSLILLAFGVRFILYSILENPWWVLPIELFQGATLGMFYPTMTSYARVVAPPGTEATVQGLVGGLFEGVGVSLGSLLGGIFYGLYGGRVTFRWFGCGALVACLIHVGVQIKLSKKALKSNAAAGRGQEEYPSIIKYATPNDAIHMLDSQDDTSLQN